MDVFWGFRIRRRYWWVLWLLGFGVVVQLHFWLPICLEHWQLGNVWFDDFVPKAPFPAVIWVIVIHIICIYALLIIHLSTLLLIRPFIALLLMFLSFANVTLSFSLFVLYINLFL